MLREAINLMNRVATTEYAGTGVGADDGAELTDEERRATRAAFETCGLRI